MTYETVTVYSQIASLLRFVGLFGGAVVYALWPGNSEQFRQAARVPLRKDDDAGNMGSTE